MLQQTTVVTVKNYFNKFVQKWPTLQDLAKSSEEEILTAWQGLGYYTRARNLLKCAQVIKNEHNGLFPKQADELLNLPGIGPYTSCAIASIAFKQKEVPIDGNIIRVMARLYNLKTPLPDLKKEIEQTIKPYKDNPKPGDFAQSLMDLGSGICTPKNPSCTECPLQKHCCAYKNKTQYDIPFKTPKPKKPTRFGKAFLIYDKEGRILLQKRPSKGLLANMMEVPSTPWLTDKDKVEKTFEIICSDGKITSFEKIVKHTFTHFHLEIDLYYGGMNDFEPRDTTSIWVDKQDLHKHPLPTLMTKIIKASS